MTHHLCQLPLCLIARSLHVKLFPLLVLAAQGRGLELPALGRQRRAILLRRTGAGVRATPSRCHCRGRSCSSGGGSGSGSGGSAAAAAVGAAAQLPGPCGRAAHGRERARGVRLGRARLCCLQLHCIPARQGIGSSLLALWQHAALRQVQAALGARERGQQALMHQPLQVREGAILAILQRRLNLQQLLGALARLYVVIVQLQVGRS